MTTLLCWFRKSRWFASPRKWDFRSSYCCHLLTRFQIKFKFVKIKIKLHQLAWLGNENIRKTPILSIDWKHSWKMAAVEKLLMLLMFTYEWFFYRYIYIDRQCIYIYRLSNIMNNVCFHANVLIVTNPSDMLIQLKLNKNNKALNHNTLNQGCN